VHERISNGEALTSIFGRWPSFVAARPYAERDRARSAQ
jgi:hypothetical protein